MKYDDKKKKFEIEPDEIYFPTGLAGGFFIYNAEGDMEILFAEQNVIELYGCSTIEEFRAFTGNSFRGMVHPEDYDKIENDILAQVFNSQKIHDYVRYRIITKQGDVRYIEDFGHLLHGKNGEKYFYVYIVDLDEEEYHSRGRNSFAESQIFSLNRNADKLTGLLTMNAFYEAVQQEIFDRRDILKGDWGGKTPAFIHFDIVNFRTFNENYGFQKGDDLLCRMAYTIRKEFEESIIARFSNDHMVVCTCMDDVEKHVEQVHNNMLEIFEGIHVEVKAGIYLLEDSCKEAGLACDYARLACRIIKRRYDKIYEFYDESVHESLLMQQYVLDNIDLAVEKEYLKVYYQPVVRVATGKICGYEALARWEDPKMGLLPPSKFIVPLEEYHMIHKVDVFVIRKVCEDLSALMEAGQPLVPVSINLSRLDFELCDIFELTERFRSRYGLPREILDIEITESALTDNSSVLNDGVEQFRKAGYHIWVDDFGSGYSSLTSLLEYDFDVLKMDLEFLRTFDRHEKTGELIRYIVKAAQGLGTQPLQEGVETLEQLDFLKAIGCERAQGYYFSKPLPLEESRAFTMEKGMEWE